LWRPEIEAIPESRRQEYEQLRSLLLKNAAVNSDLTLHRAEWIARSAIEPGHLWRSMGLTGREELRELLRESFPALEAANTKDMRWKRFFYKRICGWSGFSA